MIIYINNIFIYSKTKIEYKFHVNKILRALKKAKLKMKIKKLIFYIQKVDFLKYIIILKKMVIKREN